jgi:hypothetical protein
MVSVQGGSAPSAGGTAQAGGDVHLVARGDVTIDPALAAAPAPSVAAVPGTATPLDASSLGSDVSLGTVRVDGTVVSGGSDPVRNITSSGDIFIDGTLQGADLGGTRQGISLTANAGTVYITGTVDTRGAGGNGQSGGSIQITAQAVVITGKLLSSGGNGPGTAGSAGAIAIATSGAMTSTGVIEAFGGNASGPGAVAGGAAADLAIRSGGDVALGGTTRLRGGAATSTAVASATGGAGAALRIDSDGAVTIGGTVDGRGGLAGASAAGAAVTAGAAGSIHIGETATPAQLALSVPVNATGGDGDAVGGKGGNFTPEPDTGAVNIAGPHAVDISGGSARSMPGVGGLATGGPRSTLGTGGLQVSGDLLANGGSIRSGGSGNGADAGRIDFELVPTVGAVMITASGMLSANGGNSGGAAVGGIGGHIWLFTRDGDATVAGKILVRGGDAPDSGGTGGGSGMVYIFTDNNHNAIYNNLGNLLVDTTGVIDSSGGNGDKGGNARSDGVKGTWPTFPDQQEEIAIFLNCDGAHGETLNWMQNKGMLIARGGAHNGNGGDVIYHGIGPGQLGMPLDPGQSQHHPPGGPMDLSGDGTGVSGDFYSE